MQRRLTPPEETKNKVRIQGADNGYTSRCVCLPASARWMQLIIKWLGFCLELSRIPGGHPARLVTAGHRCRV